MTTPRIIIGVVLQGALMKSAIIKHSVKVDGRHTTVNIEDAFWNGLRDIAERRNEDLSRLIGNINAERHQGSLSSACRLYVLRDYQYRVTLA
jgi:predicted DNA-binding ribbon-helix-helix protein